VYVHLPTLGRVLRLTFSPRRFRPRHAVFAVAGLVVAGLLWAVVSALRALDRVLHPGFRSVRVEAPIYIVANPRSGTTFLHRLLSLDPRFTTLRLWQTILPSVTAYRLVAWLGRADARCGRPLARAAGAFDRTLFGGWEGIHSTGLSRAEEDEMFWVYALLTPSVMLLFPWLDELQALGHVDRMPRSVRARMGRTYLGHLQRHLYAVGPGKTLLAKNALAAGRVRTVRSVVPDMRVVHLVRHPYEAVSSTLSMFTKPWEVHSPGLVGDTEASRGWARLACDSYRTLLSLRSELPPECLVEIRYDDLVRDPEAAVRRVYDAFGLELTPELAATLRREAERGRDWESPHQHDLARFGLSEEEIYAELKDVFEAYRFER